MSREIEELAEILYHQIDGHESWRFDADEDERNEFRGHAKALIAKGVSVAKQPPRMAKDYQCKDCGAEFTEDSDHVEYSKDCYCGGDIVKKVSPPQVLDEKEIKKLSHLAYRAVADGFWEGKLELSWPITQICSLAGIIDYAVRSIVQRFSASVPTVNQINEVIAEQWLQGNIVCTEHKDKCNVDGFRVSTAIHNLLISRGKV